MATPAATPAREMFSQAVKLIQQQELARAAVQQQQGAFAGAAPAAPQTLPSPTPLPLPQLIQIPQSTQPLPTPGKPNVLTTLAMDTAATIHDGKIMRWALAFMFVTAIAGLASIIQIQNAQPTSSCWGSAAANGMAVVCVLVTIIVCIMVGVTIAYYHSQPVEQVGGAKRTFLYPPFVFFAFLTLVALVSWILLVDVTAKGRAGQSNTGTASVCLSQSDYMAGIAGGLMALTVSFFGTIGAYYWSLKH